MKIIIKGSSEEIAALVVTIQERPVQTINQVSLETTSNFTEKVNDPLKSEAVE